MQVELSASGSPSQVYVAIGQQISQARKEHPEAGALLHATRDYVRGIVSAAKPEDTIAIEASLTVKSTVTPAPEPEREAVAEQ